MSTLNTLSPETIPLSGCHLIEASAGTGKTFNITRIYLRLLLESQLDVKKILVMTFTRAATEELRGRIANEIRFALGKWNNFDKNDSFYQYLNQNFSYKEAKIVLQNALLHLDEASIFTIHSFCKRVLTQYAFSSGMDFNLQLQADTSEIELDAVRDWYRVTAYEPHLYQQISINWSSPETFYTVFRDLLSSTTHIKINDPKQIVKDFQTQKVLALAQLRKHQTQVFAALIDSHKQSELRSQEWDILIQWLAENELDKNLTPMPKEASNVFNGARFPKKDATVKEQLISLFLPLKQLKTEAIGLENKIEQAQNYQLAKQAILSIREKIIQAKKQLKVMNYDDLIYQLAERIENENAQGSKHLLSKQIRGAYPVALVDEFQDTDPQQYAILKAVYYQQKTALYLIGDPKQAIYAFRSGDIFTYLSARKDADESWFMDTNWRSSSNMVSAYNRLFYGADIDQEAQDVFGFGIEYATIKAAGMADKSALSGESASNSSKSNALEFIYFPFNEIFRSGKTKKLEMKQEFCGIIAKWCASEIHRLLTNQVCIGEATLQEQDIAILVRDKREAVYIQTALAEINYASVYLSSHENVFYSEEAQELKKVLKSLLQLDDTRLMTAALATRFFGCDSMQLAEMHSNLLNENAESHNASQLSFEAYQREMLNLFELWCKRSFMSMALKLLHQHYKPAFYFHERALTNIVHLFELLQQASQQHKQPEQLYSWFCEQMESRVVSQESELRLESDANLIRIMTQHGAKGLEYPIVFIPFSTRYKDPAKFGNKSIELFKYHHSQTGELNYFIGKDKVITELYQQEAWAETIRLLYVAITRAVHRCYLCVTPFSGYEKSPLGLTLKLSSLKASSLEQEYDDILLCALDVLDKQQIVGIHVQQVDDLSFPVTHHREVEPQHHLVAANFTGFIEKNWWLSSFSALSRNLRHGGISLPERDTHEEEVLLKERLPTIDELRFSLKKGATTGNLLHDILERTDFINPQWHRAMQYPLVRYNEVVDVMQQDELIAWLESCLATELQEGLQLNQLSWSHTLRETEFYFPMENVNPQDLNRLLIKHREQRGVTAEQISANLLGSQHLKGMMHGFIDLIFQHQGKYYLLDYKSTHLGHHFDDYKPEVLLNSIVDNFYDLQYLIYSLALHRYLSSRLADYKPAKHFGGVYYLYLRGMQPKSDTGIFYTPMDTEMLDELDTLFAR